MDMAQYLAGLAALMVFVAVLLVFLSAVAAREREAAHRRSQAELRTRGA